MCARQTLAAAGDECGNDVVWYRARVARIGGSAKRIWIRSPGCNSIPAGIAATAKVQPSLRACGKPTCAQAGNVLLALPLEAARGVYTHVLKRGGMAVKSPLGAVLS